jgi:hypothetical protein
MALDYEGRTMSKRDADKSRVMRKNAFALRALLGPLQEVSLDEICGVQLDRENEWDRNESVLRRRLAGGSYDRSRETHSIGSDDNRCDGCRRAVPLVCTIEMQMAVERVRRRYCAECARLIGDWKPPPNESA